MNCSIVIMKTGHYYVMKRKTACYQTWQQVSTVRPLMHLKQKNSYWPCVLGLNSILFAVSIDRPELNSGNPTQNIQRLKTRAEPIIEAPIPGNYNFSM